MLVSHHLFLEGFQGEDLHDRTHILEAELVNNILPPAKRQNSQASYKQK